MMIGQRINTFADNVVIFANKLDDISQLTKLIMEETGKRGLKLNDVKTKSMRYKRNTNGIDHGFLQINVDTN